MKRAWIMMYHRICPYVAGSCYHERGTAVTPERFAAHVRWLAERFEMVRLVDAWRELRENIDEERSYCVLTFDDGYRDTIDYALPICESLGVPISVFPVAGPLAGGDAVWVDRYYDLLHRARRRTHVLAGALDIEGAPGEPIPGLDEDLRWWVRGPVKERLQTLAPGRRHERLRYLAEVLDADWRDELTNELYMTRDALMELVAAGHDVGGHGWSHSRLTYLDDRALAGELERSVALLRELDVREPLAFCYPDGGYDERVQRAVSRAGFTFACTVEYGPATTVCDPLALPRCLVRNAYPPFQAA